MATILVVDDQATNRDFLVTLLSHAGHRMLECANGAAALEMARSKHPDLIICDVVMPIMNGVEFVNALSADPAIAGIQVVFYSAAFRVEEVYPLAQSCGVTNVLLKTSDPQIVLDTVNKLLGLPAHPPTPAFLREGDRKNLRKDRVPTIRSRLALLAMACVIPASLMAVTLIYYDYHRNREQLVHDSIAIARALIHAIDRDLASAESALLALATSPYLISDNLAAFYQQAKGMLRDPTASNIVLTDGTGQQRINTFRPFGQPLPMHTNPGQLRHLFETAQPVFSDLFLGGVTRKPFVRVDVPVRRGNKVVYALGMGIPPQRLSKTVAQQQLPPAWIGAIFDSTGTIVARTHDMERFVGKKGPTDMIQRMSTVSEDSLETTTPEGTPVLYVFSHSPVSHWTAAVGIPKAELTRMASYSLGWIVVATIIVLTAGLGLAWIIGGRISRSFHALTEPALALGFGEKVTVPPLHLKEADEIGNALVKASLMLDLVRHQAQHDPLTGLANRLLFNEFVKQQLAVCHRTGATFAILYLDLDGFKRVNDKHGHATGDELLHAVAGKLKGGLRASDIAARLGGDEFAAVLIDANMEGAAAVAGKLVEKLSIPYQIRALTLEISVSIGIAIYPDSGTTSEALFHRADEAMYTAKTTGKRRYVVATQPLATGTESS